MVLHIKYTNTKYEKRKNEKKKFIDSDQPGNLCVSKEGRS